jgi:drug/metabolite transporter (DMT)-like permease
MKLHLGSRRATATAALRVVVAGACWGLSAVIAKIAFDRGVPPTRMAEARVVVALAVLALLLVPTRRDLFRPPPGSLPVLAAFGLCVALVNGSYYVAIDRLAVGVAISLQYTAPVLLLGIAALSRAGRRGLTPSARTPTGRLAWIAAAITLAGAALVSQVYRGFGRLDGIGLIAAAGSALFFAGYLLTAEAAGRKGADPATVLVWGFVFAILFWSFASPWWSWPVGKLSDVHVALAVVGVGIVGTLVPFFLAVGAVRVLSPAMAGIAATVEPPFAAGFAWLFLSQHLSAIQILGGVMVLAGIAVSQRGPAITAQAMALEVSP